MTNQSSQPIFDVVTLEYIRNATTMSTMANIMELTPRYTALSLVIGYLCQWYGDSSMGNM